MSLDAEILTRRLTFAEFAAMGELPKHVELFDGLLSPMPPRGDAHTLVCAAIHAALNRYIIASGRDDELVVVSEPTLRLSDETGVEPDVAVLDGPIARYIHEGISAQRVRLIAEVADTSLARDLGDKVSRYATSAIPEYWVADISARCIHVFDSPKNGKYESRIVCTAGEVASRTIPGLRIELAQIFAAVA
jgi:Uma2 family endonuclease